MLPEVDPITHLCFQVCLPGLAHHIHKRRLSATQTSDLNHPKRVLALHVWSRSRFVFSL